MSKLMRNHTFIDRFSVGVDEMSRKDQGDDLKVLRRITDAGRFSCFEASDNPVIANTMTRLIRGPLVESYLPDRYRGRVDVDGLRGPDQSTYPWTYVRLTNRGRRALQDAGDE